MPLREIATRLASPRIGLLAMLVMALAGLLVPTCPAQARVFIGIGVPFFGPPVYYPPYYYPPPVYYAPPPVVYAPPQPQPQSYAPPSYAPQSYAPQSYAPAPSAAGQTCYAGAYTCPMDVPTAAGTSCYCLGNGSARVWGRSN